MIMYKRDSTNNSHSPRDTQCYRVTVKMLKLLATAAVLLALTPQWVDSTTTAISHSKGHLLMKKVGCSTNHQALPTMSQTFLLCSSNVKSTKNTALTGLYYTLAALVWAGRVHTSRDIRGTGSD